MSLTLGAVGMPANWAAPSPLFNYITGVDESGGMVWVGRNPCIAADKDALKAVFGPSVKMDKMSLVGMNSPKYATFLSANQGKGAYKQTLIVKGKKQ